MNQYTATQVGSYFVEQYYKVFNGKRDHAHKFYTDESSILVIDGNIKRSASKTEKIHELIMSSKFMEVEIDTTNSLESLNGGVLVVVSGSLHFCDFTGSRKFVQTFFLAPQEKGGYFVLNDVFHLMPCIFHQTMDCDNALKEESVSLVEPVDEAVLSTKSRVCLVEKSVLSKPIQDHQLLQASADSLDESDDLTSRDESDQQLEKTCDELDELISPQLEKTCADDLDELKSPQLEKTCDEMDELKSPSKETNSNDCSMIFETWDFPTLQELYAIARPRDKLNHAMEKKEETVGQIETPTYACLVNGKSQPSVRSNGAVYVSFLKELIPALPKFDAKEPCSVNTFSSSVYVKNLSSTVTSLDVLYEFKKFGKIKPDGVFLRNNQGSSSSFAFVEFQDIGGAAKAIKASPIQMGGRRVYIEHKRSKSGASSVGRRAEHFGRSLGRNNLENGCVNQ